MNAVRAVTILRYLQKYVKSVESVVNGATRSG